MMNAAKVMIVDHEPQARRMSRAGGVSRRRLSNASSPLRCGLADVKEETTVYFPFISDYLDAIPSGRHGTRET